VSNIRERAQNPAYPAKFRELILNIADELEWLDVNANTADGAEWERRMGGVNTVIASLEGFVTGYRAHKGAHQ
jgi:hypothetical protein